MEKTKNEVTLHNSPTEVIKFVESVKEATKASSIEDKEGLFNMLDDIIVLVKIVKDSIEQTLMEESVRAKAKSASKARPKKVVS